MAKVPCGAGTWSNETGAVDINTCEACGVPEACLEGGLCADGHISLEEGFCFGCLDFYYKENDRCLACPENTTVMMVVAGAVFIVFALVILKLGQAGKKRDSNKAGASITIPFSILFTELQITFRLYKLNLYWPEFVLRIVRQLSAYLEFDFVSLSMTAPECSFEFDTPADGYIFRQQLITVALPTFCILIGLMHLMFSCCIATVAMSGSRMNAYLFLVRTVPIEVANACVVAFSTMYIMIMSTAADAWHCTTRVNDELHMDSYPQILCTFEAAGYPRIFVGGIVMLGTYGVGLPMLMWWTLSRRNQRAIPRYPEEVEWPDSKCKIVTKRAYKFFCDALFNCVTLPCLALGFLFKDKDALKAIEGDEERLAEFEAAGGLESRMRGGDHITGLLCVPALINRGGEKLDAYAGESLMLNERLRGGGGGKKDKKRAAKLARDAEGSFSLPQHDEEEVEAKRAVPKKAKKLKAKPLSKGKSKSLDFENVPDKQEPSRGRKLRAGSYRDAGNSGEQSESNEWAIEGKRSAKGKLKSASYSVGSSKLKSKSTRERREQIASSSLKSVDEGDSGRTNPFAEQQHPILTKDKKSKKTMSFKELSRQTSRSMDDGGSDADRNVPRKTQKGERAKIMDRIKRAGATVASAPEPELEAGLESAAAASEADPELEPETEPDTEGEQDDAADENTAVDAKNGQRNGKNNQRLTRKQRIEKAKGKPWYEVDTRETDGYIYWDEATRRTLGWIYLRYKPNRWCVHVRRLDTALCTGLTTNDNSASCMHCFTSTTMYDCVLRAVAVPAGTSSSSS
eukprot:SAG22_NODE_584_length_8876_cov_42.811667_6_plen_799_part_00